MILHVDGDSFFASCEMAVRPGLSEMAVVTGAERGIASAMSRKAKLLGITRGMPIFEIRQKFPEVLVFHSDYELYSIFSRRMYKIVMRYADKIERYSIDECFAEIRIPENRPQDILRVAQKIKSDLEIELGMTFSVGVAKTKTLAKIASSFYKPSGLCVLDGDMEKFLSKIPIGDVWGIGRRTSPRFRAFGISSAYHLANMDEKFIDENFSKPFKEIWYELRGIQIHTVVDEYDDQKSIAKTRTFSPSSDVKEFVFSELVKNAEGATARARELGLYANTFSFFLKDSNFQYVGRDFRLMEETNTPENIVNIMQKSFNDIWKHKKYRATGVILGGLSTQRKQSLFYFNQMEDKKESLYQSIDELNQKYGSALVHLAGAKMSREKWKKIYSESDIHEKNEINQNLIFKNFSSRPLYIPFWGETC